MKIADLDFDERPLGPSGRLWTPKDSVDMRRLVQEEALPDLVKAVREAGLVVIDGINGVPCPSGTDELLYQGNDPRLAHLIYPTQPHFVPCVDFLYPGKNPADMAFARLSDLALGAQSKIAGLEQILREAAPASSRRYDLERLLAQTRAEGGYYPPDFREFSKQLPSWDEMQAESPGLSRGRWEPQWQLDARARQKSEENRQNRLVWARLLEFYADITHGAPRYTHSWAAHPNSVVLTFQGADAPEDPSKIVLPFPIEPKSDGPMGVHRDFISSKGGSCVYELFSRWLADERRRIEDVDDC